MGLFGRSGSKSRPQICWLNCRALRHHRTRIVAPRAGGVKDRTPAVAQFDCRGIRPGLLPAVSFMREQRPRGQEGRDMNETPTALGSCNRIEGRLYTIKYPLDQPVAGGTYRAPSTRTGSGLMWRNSCRGGPPACRIRANAALKSIACCRNTAQPFMGIPQGEGRRAYQRTRVAHGRAHPAWPGGEPRSLWRVRAAAHQRTEGMDRRKPGRTWPMMTCAGRLPRGLRRAGRVREPIPIPSWWPLQWGEVSDHRGVTL